MSLAFLSLYFLVLLFPAVFGLHRYHLIRLYRRHKNDRPNPPAFEALSSVPMVTVQLPIFNEKYVATRLMRAVCDFDYPRDKLEIQVLDDSTDDTVAIVAREVEYLREKGFDIKHLCRTHREGFKAGALNEGLKVAKGEFVAIFDADFVPSSDFLKKTIPCFALNPKMGMVQTRWEHLNRSYSLLTRAQAILLDGHFIIEHTARNRSGCFFNFNGTAGVWRRDCIWDAGGWSGDTLTEDIDLSYRAQMKGWQFLYLEDVVAPAELPVDMNSLKSQQHRWAKGSIQVARKLLPTLLKGDFPMKVKLEAFFHLAANVNYLLMTVISILMPFAVYIRYQEDLNGMLWLDLPLFVSATLSVCVFYYHSQKDVYESRWARLKYIFFALAAGIGLCVNNSKAVIDGFLNTPGEFTRTPKYAVINKGDSWKDKVYHGKFNWVCFVELLLALHFTVAAIFCLSEGLYFSLPFVMLFQIGFSYTTVMSFLQSRYSTKLVPETPVPALAE